MEEDLQTAWEIHQHILEPLYHDFRSLNALSMATPLLMSLYNIITPTVDGNLVIFAHSYNTSKIIKGMAGLKFVS